MQSNPNNDPDFDPWKAEAEKAKKEKAEQSTPNTSLMPTISGKGRAKKAKADFFSDSDEEAKPPKKVLPQGGPPKAGSGPPKAGPGPPV